MKLEVFQATLDQEGSDDDLQPERSPGMMELLPLGPEPGHPAEDVVLIQIC